MQVGQLVAWGERAFWFIAGIMVYHISWVVKVDVQLVLAHHPERDGMYIGFIETLAGSSHAKKKRVMELQWDTEGSVGFSRCPCDVASIAIWLNLEAFETIALDIPMYAVEVAVEAFVYHLAPDSEPMALENGKNFRNSRLVSDSQMCPRHLCWLC